jgi:predicted PurR-regulated permease PerM
MLKLLNKTYINGLNPLTIIFAVFFLLGLYFLFLIREILVLIFLAFILMVALKPLSKKIHTLFKLPLGFSIFLSYIVLLFLLVVFFAVLVPPLVTQLSGLLKFVNIPVLQEQILEFKFTLTEISDIAGKVGTSVGAIFSIIGSTFSGIFTFFTLLVLSYFLLVERQDLPQKLSWFTRDKSEKERFSKLIDSIEEQLGGWVRGEIILMLMIGILTFVGLTLLGVPYALPLAMLAGMLEILPNIGPTSAAVPAIAIAFITNGPVMAGAVLILNILIQQLENNFFVPKVMKAAANVSPLASIISILIGLKLGGVMGALLAVPLYIVMRTVYSVYFYQHRS